MSIGLDERKLFADFIFAAMIVPLALSAPWTFRWIRDLTVEWANPRWIDPSWAPIISFIIVFGLAGTLITGAYYFKEDIDRILTQKPGRGRMAGSDPLDPNSPLDTERIWENTTVGLASRLVGELSKLYLVGLNVLIAGIFFVIAEDFYRGGEKTFIIPAVIAAALYELFLIARHRRRVRRYMNIVQNSGAISSN